MRQLRFLRWIPVRFSLALTGIGLLLFGAYAAISYRGEVRDLHGVADREIRTLGRSLQVAIENALRDRQPEDISETLAKLELLDPSVDVVIFDPSWNVVAASAGSRPELAFRSLPPGLDATVRWEPADHPVQQLYAVRLASDAGGTVGVLAVTRPLDEYNRDLGDTRGKLWTTALLLVVTTLAVGVALGFTSVTRPLRALTEAMRLAHRGDSTYRVEARHDDEVGMVAREFNAMMDDLNQVRRSLIEEGERRVRMESSLRQLDRLVTIGELAAGLAHEIGSPLQVLNGRARLLQARPDDAAEVTRHAGILVEQTERVSRIVERMLKFGRRVPPRLAPCNLVTLVKATLDLVETDARRRGVAMAFHADDPAVMTLGEEDQLQQVTLNLVLNALDATPVNGAIEVRLERGEETVALVVSDTGRGISEDALPHIFDAFFTTRAQEGGTGLGLAVVKTIVHEHHGKVTARSNAGAGTTFRVELPRHHGART